MKVDAELIKKHRVSGSGIDENRIEFEAGLMKKYRVSGSGIDGNHHIS